MRSRNFRALLIGAAAAALAGCGGSGVNSLPYVGGPTPTPTPAPAPTPAPTPTPTPAPTAAAPVPLSGVTEDTTFATYGSALKIRWDEAAKTYDIKFPDSEWAALKPRDDGYGGYELVADSSVVGLVPTDSFGPADGYSYTGMIDAYASGQGAPEIIAFGIPTAASEIPVTGTASFAGSVRGWGWGYYIFGDALFQFDFGAGTLAGHFDKLVANNPAWISGPIGRYDFVNTVYSTGSTNFSGGLRNPDNSLTGSFTGSFNGPNAAELMGQWNLKFADPCGGTSSATGVVIAKKQ